MNRLVAVLLAVLSPAVWAADEPVPGCTAHLETRLPGGFDIYGNYSEVERYLDSCSATATPPFLQAVIDQGERIRNDRSRSPFCDGTIVNTQLERYRVQLDLVNKAPRLLVTAKMGFPEPSILQNYLKRWALLSPANFAMSLAFIQSRRDAQPLLARHYQAHFGLPADEAEFAADKALELIARRAAGAYAGGGRGIEPNVLTTVFPLTTLLSEPGFQPAALTQALAANPSAPELDQALKLALTQNLPLPVLSELLSHMDNLDAGDESALFFALRNPDALALLLNHGASVDYANGFGKTALFYAIETGNLQTVKTLLDQGANPNHAYKTAEQLQASPLECVYRIEHSQRTPLMHAAQHSDPSMLALLLSRGARRNDVDGLGWKAVDYAARNNRPENAAFLSGLSGQAASQ